MSSRVPLALSEIENPKTLFSQLLETGSQSAPALTPSEAKDIRQSLEKPDSQDLAQSGYEASDLTADPELAQQYDDLDRERHYHHRAPFRVK
ncbi:hypothetical protein R3P38DRAFT_3293790 [Favolaschia claudopus]|uniref:Uncharacterized protein n=1 Tax=Favolaschia claudopus TaxID=2862362 RepID=A0AAV9ZG54_9AGAR